MLKGCLSKFSFVPHGIDIEACEHLLSTCQTKSVFKMNNIMNNVVITDFDETITNRDTTCLLGELPYILNPQLQPPWSHIVNVYREHCQKFQSNAEQRRLPLLPLGKKTVITNANFMKLFQGELEFQKSKRLLELSSITEVEFFGLFKGIKHEEVRSYVKNMLQCSSPLLRPGFEDFVALISKERFFVVSVNWSSEFIRYVIGRENICRHNIICNGLMSSGDEYTGRFTKFPLTGLDKLKAIQQVSSKYNDSRNNYRLWFVGDSDTDLLGILYPNINGILLIDPIAESQKFYKVTVQLLGLDQKDMNEFASDSSQRWYECCAKQGGKAIYIVRSWEDLGRLMFGDD